MNKKEEEKMEKLLQNWLGGYLFKKSIEENTKNWSLLWKHIYKVAKTK